MKNPKDLLTPLSPNSSDFTSIINGSAEGLKRYYIVMTALDTGLFECTITPKTAQVIAEETGGLPRSDDGDVLRRPSRNGVTNKARRQIR